jgi:hypothetical protein
MKQALAALFSAITFGVMAIDPPTGLITVSGDQSIVVYWNPVSDTNITGYRVSSSTNAAGPFALRTTVPIKFPGYCDLNVTNGEPRFYRVTAFVTNGVESLPNTPVSGVAHEFANDDEFLDYAQRIHFGYFWYGANPANGLIPDRIPSASPCSIAAVGFGLTAIGIGIDHGWISRTQGLERVRTTLRTFQDGPQGASGSGMIGYKGWFYHFLDMKTAVRYAPFNSELSSIDTALLLGGVLDAKQYFDRDTGGEKEIRSLADTIFDRVDWNWMARGSNVLSMGWRPPASFLASQWIGYNEAMILYCLGLGANTNPLPASAWNGWTSGYKWMTYYGQSYVPFAPLFGHQYSHCWIDFRHIADAYMISNNSSYFENSRRATLAQRSYCIANPKGWTGYSSNVWGLTACDGPNGYAARGAPPSENDDGTIAPTAAGGSIAFAPEFSVPALRHMYTQYRSKIWTAFGFKDGFNLRSSWFGPDELGIDQGPIVIMIENYRTQRVWRRFMQNPEVRRGLQRAGFLPLTFVPPSLRPSPTQGEALLSWPATTNRAYRVEYSPDLAAWFASPTEAAVAEPIATWADNGPPATQTSPATASQRFYRVFQLGPP